MTVTGIIKQVGKTQKVSDKFTKRELILKTEYGTPYPQYLLIQFTQKNVSKLDAFHPGDLVTVSLNIKGRQYTDKNGNETAFNTLEGWHIEKDEETVVPQPTTGMTEEEQDESTLPF